MALRGASTTVDQDWLDFGELAKEGPAVVFTVLELEPAVDFGNGSVEPVIARVIILTGSRAGEVYPRERVLAKGIRSKLTAVGDDVVGRLELYNRGSRKHPGLNAEQPGDLALAEQALAKYSNARNGSASETSSRKTRSKVQVEDNDPDDAPPF